MAMAICAGDFRTPRTVNPELPEAFERVIQQAMALSANDRFVGMRQLGAALLPSRAIARVSSGHRRSGARGPTASSRTPRRR